MQIHRKVSGSCRGYIALGVLHPQEISRLGWFFHALFPLAAAGQGP